MSRTIIATAILGLVIVAALALPASAAQANGNAAGKAAIDPQLKADLWDNHHQYRLEHFDLNVQRATSVIGILDKYGIDTAKPEATLATISGEREALDTALASQDREALKTINQELLSLWKQFAQEVKESIKDHYRGVKAEATATATDAGLTDDSQALSL